MTTSLASQEDTLRAAVLGTAIGDAWGHPHEFTARETTHPSSTIGAPGRSLS